MPVAERNGTFDYVATYVNNLVTEKNQLVVDDTQGVGANAAAVAGTGDERSSADDNDKNKASAVREFSNASSMHGIKYVWAGNRSKPSRILWALVFLGMFGALGSTLFVQLREMGTFPTLTKQTLTMESELLFPAVTICNLNQFRKSVVENNTLLLRVLRKMSDLGFLFGTINFTDSVWLDANDNETSPEAIAQLLDSAPHPLNRTFGVCRWRHEERPCFELFKTVVTAFGVCYSFNTHETEKEQRKSNLFGNMYGLSIILHTNQPEYVLSQWNIASGFRVLLHGFWETPQIIEKGFSLGPGSSYFGKISTQKMTFLPAPFKAFGNKDCIDCTKGELEGYLRYFPIYDRGACFLECQMNYTSNACGCRGLYDPAELLLPLCDLQTLLVCHLPRSREFRENNTLRHSCNCPVSCKWQTYDVSLSMASYPSDVLMENYNNIQPPEWRLDQDFYRTNFLELNLYYDNPQMVNIEQFPQYTFESIMSSIGGQMGVFLGASLISLVEFVEFIIGLVMSKIAMAKNKVAKLNTIPVKK